MQQKEYFDCLGLDFEKKSVKLRLLPYTFMGI